jgi:hypothetical protein
MKGASWERALLPFCLFFGLYRERSGLLIVSSGLLIVSSGLLIARTRLLHKQTKCRQKHEGNDKEMERAFFRH